MPATKTKPDTTTPAPVAELSREQITRCHRVAAALAVLEHELSAYLENSESYDVVPRKVFFDALENMFIEVADQKHIPWPGTAACFLTAVLALAQALQENSDEWRQTISAKALRRCVGVCEFRNSLEDPQPDGQPRVIFLEPLSELLDQKVPFAQICRIFSWRTPSGEPDIARLRRAIAGDENEVPPTTDVFPAKVERCPPLAAIDALLESFVQVEQAAFDEQALTAAVAVDTISLPPE